MTPRARRDPRIRRWATGLAGASGTVTALTAAGLLWQHLTRFDGPLPRAEASLAVVLVASTGVLMWAWWMRHRGETFRPQFGIGVTAALALALGIASYAPCATPHQWPVVVVGLLNLFTGQVETALIGDASATCVDHPLVFQLARLFGLATLVFSALAVLAALVRPFLDHQRARFARVIDVVVGLDATTLPLVKALCQERDAYRYRPDWYKRRGRLGDWDFWANPRPTVVVVHHTDSDPLVEEARAHGALVYVGTPTDPDVLRPIVFWLWRVSLHRLYAVTASQGDNVAIVDAVQTMIADRRSDADMTWLSSQTVPRLIARFSDARDARDWRLQKVSALGCFLDAITLDGLLARALVDRVAEYEASDLLISGDTPLAFALLDQVAQQRAFRAELQQERALSDERVANQQWSNPEENTLNQVCQLAFEEVTILADTAAELCDEWRSGRAPGAAKPTLLEPRARPADWTQGVADVVARGGNPVLIITDPPSPLVSVRAKRLSDRYPGLLVLRPSHNVQGVESLTGADGTTQAGTVVVRFGPTLVHDGRAPDDTWTVLARQQHECFCHRRTPPRDDWPASRLEWERGPGGLPDFFREDTLRHHRHLLMLIEEHGYRWRVATLASRGPGVPRFVLAAVAEREHQRWCDFRERTGWRPVSAKLQDSPKKELDWLRRNANLVPWGPYDARAETVHQEYNIGQAVKIVERLRLWGVEPVADRYRRVGAVTASPLTERRTWTTDRGDELTSQPGDFWVVDADGSGRGVARGRFAELYEPTEVAGRFRRRGTVMARRVRTSETVPTLEGAAVAEPGMWVLTDDHGDAWPVTDDYLARHYRREG